MVLSVVSPNGRRASPYRIDGKILVKRLSERHIYRARQAVGIDEAVWRQQRDRVAKVRFTFPNGLSREIDADEFERKSFLHGDDIKFRLTRFVRLVDLKPVKPCMLPLFEQEVANR